jgi:hypothetical protein
MSATGRSPEQRGGYRKGQLQGGWHGKRKKHVQVHQGNHGSMAWMAARRASGLSPRWKQDQSRRSSVLPAPWATVVPHPGFVRRTELSAALVAVTPTSTQLATALPLISEWRLSGLLCILIFSQPLQEAKFLGRPGMLSGLSLCRGLGTRPEPH